MKFKAAVMFFMIFNGFHSASAAILDTENVIDRNKIALKEVPFDKESALEFDPETRAKKCLDEFFQKGGNLEFIPSLMEEVQSKFKLSPGDAVFPVCSGGWCRSQTLWAILSRYSDQIILFPPHAARMGWDPYNGQINRYRNYDNEVLSDEFTHFFNFEKAQRFGFENTPEWELIEKSPTSEGLKKISQFYDQYYFGPESHWQGKQGKRRIFITFSHNTHVALLRLNQNNESLEDVTILSIQSDDIISLPPEGLNTSSRSQKAYEYFTIILRKVFDFSELDNLI